MMLRRRFFVAVVTTAICGLTALAADIRDYLDRPETWHRSAEGRASAANVLSHQSAKGSWPKNSDTASKPYEGDRARIRGTFDNGATIGELVFLARAFRATNDDAYRRAFLLGLDHVLAAQYPTGGWPQYHPPGEGYPRYITFNDETMVRLMRFVRDVATVETYAFVDDDRRDAAGSAFERGVECILKCQVRVNGKLTAWCAQHDEVTFVPRPARSYELVSLSGSESVGIVRLLMSIEKPSPAMIEAVDAAVAWLDAVKLTGIRVERRPDPAAPRGTNKVVVHDPAAPPLWARFYEIGTNQPIYADRDGVIKRNLADIGYERRNGYGWLGSWAQKLLDEEYPAWKRRLKAAPAASRGALEGIRHRVLISTDIGGTDPDDFQSLIHYLMYADLFDTEGLISSPPGSGRASDILRVIDRYEQDHPKLKRHSKDFPSPDALRAITKQGAIDRAPLKGWRNATEGSRWIVQCAMKDDPRPLYVLVWGGIDDLAQALHDEPRIATKIRVYFIGGPNKKWSADAYHYIERNFPHLWMIESNATYRGWFVGGDQDGELGNRGFYERYIKGRGALGTEFGNHYNGTIKMGDTPSVAYLLRGDPDRPDGESWGGSYVRTSARPRFLFRRHTTHADIVETFGVIEWELRGPDRGAVASDEPAFQLEIEGQQFDGYYDGGGVYRVRFVPKSSGKWNYVMKSAIAELDGGAGGFTSIDPTPQQIEGKPSSKHTRWWTDNVAPEQREGPHQGARTISRWREDYLRDWSKRLAWLVEDEN